jgi:transcriptional regulator with XRE-family HTH domain
MSEWLIRAWADWAAGFRARKEELGYSDADIEERGGLPAGYCNKILNAKKKPGAVKIEQLCRALQLEVALRPAIDTDENRSEQIEHLRTLRLSRNSAMLR